jgi:hypothetical protein
VQWLPPELPCERVEYSVSYAVHPFNSTIDELKTSITTSQLNYTISTSPGTTYTICVTVVADACASQESCIEQTTPEIG